MLRDDTVNRRLKELLRERKLKQTVVAEKCGMGYQSLHRAVNGKRPIYLPGSRSRAALRHRRRYRRGRQRLVRGAGIGQHDG